MTDPTICGATWQDAAGLTHTCDRRPHGDEHLHAENSGEDGVTTDTVDFEAWAQAEAGDRPATTAELFPTVEEVGAKAIEMFKHDPNWWRRTFPLELASIIDRWLEAHGEPIAKVIKAGTRVRLRTSNGGDTICELATDYRPTYGCEFRQIRDNGTVSDRRWFRLADDIVSVDIDAPRTGLDRCTCGSEHWDGHTCRYCGQRWLGISVDA